jgi:hypothetical protein
MSGNKQDDLIVMRTPNPACPACKVFRLHSKEEFAEYHPFAGTGVNWDSPRIKAK